MSTDDRYTHYVKRASGYVAGWLKSEQEAERFAAECNQAVPGDPAHVEEIEGDEAWAALVAEALDTPAVRQADAEAQRANYLLSREAEVESDRLTTRHFEEGF